MGYTHGTQWTDEHIREKLLEVVTGMDLKRMPSRKECEQFFQNCSLTNAVTRHGGWIFWAEQLGLPVKNSETYFGKTQEREIADLLRARGYEVRQMPQNFPYDLLVDDYVKVDVKASHLYEGKTGDFYTFNLEKPFATCDIYILCTLDCQNVIQNIYIVPSKFVMTNTQISIGTIKSKYDRFIDAWEYLDNLTNYWDAVS